MKCVRFGVEVQVLKVVHSNLLLSDCPCKFVCLFQLFFLLVTNLQYFEATLQLDLK